MEKRIIAPSKYIQGAKLLENLSDFVKEFGDCGLIIWSPEIEDIVGNTVKKNLGSNIKMESFNGECSKKEINRIKEICTANNYQFIVAIGGGKTIDTAKAVGDMLNIKVVVIPTAASSDAPTSALSVIYSEEGEFEEYYFTKNNPNLVLMDLDVIAKAPTRLLIAGIGDALSTYFEARACSVSNSKAMAKGHSTNAALMLAKLCYEIITRDGLAAVASCKQNVVTKALENVVEANTYLSGIGFESGGLAACHSVHNGLTVIEKLHNMYHGEKVAYGVLVQLMLENSLEEFKKITEFNRSIGLPVSLKDLGVGDIDDELLFEAATLACAETETIHNLPFEVNATDVFAAFKLIEEYNK
ncbi:MAG: glycerol dehydrogenase [Anaerorhabdus sp.]